MLDQTKQRVPDLYVSAEIIQYYAEIDLGFDELLGRRDALVALSIRMDAAFRACWESELRLLAEEYDEVSREVLLTAVTRTAHDFIERYGVLGLFSTDVLRVFWEAQRPHCQSGPKRLRLLGQKLANFAMACKNYTTKKTIGLAFQVNKPHFLVELHQLSRELGVSGWDKPFADQIIEFVKNGDYAMLKPNLTLLQEFLRCPQINPDLNEKNAVAADLLAQFGIGKHLGERRSPSMAPDQFFCTWMGWITNKRRNTIQRQIKTAASRWRTWLSQLIRGTKNR